MRMWTFASQRRPIEKPPTGSERAGTGKTFPRRGAGGGEVVGHPVPTRLAAKRRPRRPVAPAARGRNGNSAVECVTDQGPPTETADLIGEAAAHRLATRPTMPASSTMRKPRASELTMPRYQCGVVTLLPSSAKPRRGAAMHGNTVAFMRAEMTSCAGISGWTARKLLSVALRGATAMLSRCAQPQAATALRPARDADIVRVAC